MSAYTVRSAVSVVADTANNAVSIATQAGISAQMAYNATTNIGNLSKGMYNATGAPGMTIWSFTALSANDKLPALDINQTDAYEVLLQSRKAPLLIYPLSNRILNYGPENNSIGLSQGGTFTGMLNAGFTYSNTSSDVLKFINLSQSSTLDIILPTFNGATYQYTSQPKEAFSAFYHSNSDNGVGVTGFAWVFAPSII